MTAIHSGCDWANAWSLFLLVDYMMVSAAGHLRNRRGLDAVNGSERVMPELIEAGFGRSEVKSKK